MASNYPAQIDSSLSLPSASDNITPVTGSVVNRLRDAIVAVQTELGVKPSGVNGTVRERLNQIDAIIETIDESISISFSGDLSGDTTSQTVIGLRGREVASTEPSDGYVLTWSQVDNAWKPSTTGVSFTAGGDLSGSSSSQTVIKINGATVPAAGSLTTGHLLKVSGASATTYGYLVNANVDAAAAIAYSKLNLGTSIVNADISGSAAIAYSKLNLGTSIVNADINAAAAIAYSKLNLAGNIVNADINASAAIAGSKISPSFGAQTVSTTTKVQADFIEIGGGTMPTTGGIRYDATQHGGEILTLRTSGGSTRQIIGLNGTDTPTFGSGSLNCQFFASTYTLNCSAVVSATCNGTLYTNTLPIVGPSSAAGMYGVHGRAAQAMADANQTPANTIYSRGLIRTTGVNTADRTLFLPVATTEDRSYPKSIQNDCTGAFDVIVAVVGGAGTTVQVASGKRQRVWITPDGVVQDGASSP